MPAIRKGKILVIAGKTEKGAKNIFLDYVSHVRDLGVDVRWSEYRVVNIIACYKHLKKIDLARLSSLYRSEYQPEIFPAVRFRDEYYCVTVNRR